MMSPTTSSLPRAMMELVGIMLLKFPPFLRIWIITLVSFNIGGILLFPSVLETKVIFAVLNMGVLLMTFLYQYYGGFTKLLGLAHIFWLALVPWLAFRLATGAVVPESYLMFWLAGVITVNSISLLLDIRDMYQYFYEGMIQPELYWKDQPTTKAE
ncbi:expressed unknown protein [Seminavis robusta]|uniref:Uncharacterized protein n=1 Tax=Seminavis robusta TaxID=568900 RepID=A0A9N8DLI1_9STRA|nr:expressed unknown protein [Seminavis robusta]|eukprot:Sro210_g087780.1 n/a (156) ;mRNA; r:85478-85945